MYLPKLSVLDSKRDMLQTFKGYNHQLRIEDGEFYDMENLTSDYYPLLSPRQKRGEVIMHSSFTGGNMIAKNRLWYQFGSTLQGYDPKEKGSIIFESAGLGYDTQFVSFGSYIVDMSEKRWFSTVPNENGTYDSGSFGYAVTARSDYFSVYICDEEGNPIEDASIGDASPEDAADQTHWFDTYSSPGVLNRYYNANGGWFEVPYYLRITFESEDNPIQIGDFVRIKAPSIQVGNDCEVKIDDLENAHEVLLTGTNENGSVYVVIKCGICGATGYSIDGTSIKVDGVSSAELQVNGDTVEVNNNIPVMDFVVESNNRLWGCRYGVNNNGEFVNEIYASKLGSFRVWEKFEGISDDSYAVSCGTDGPFTGAISYGGYPLFFKEKYLHRVYGTYPFQITPYECNGVQEGCGKSLAIINNILFYKSLTGICTYTGSLPQLLELPFGGDNYKNCIAAGTQTKYYLSATGETGKVLFVYDTKTGTLHKEDSLDITDMCMYGTEVYALVSMVKDGFFLRGIICLTNGDIGNGPVEEKVKWFAETGIIGLSLPDKKYVISMDLRMSLAVGSTVTVSVQYDSVGDWEHLYTMTGKSIRSFNVPIRVKRCDHLRLRIAGEGEAKIYSIAKTIEQGSEV